MKAKFNHFNINVSDLQKSLDFYDQALGLKVQRIKDAEDGSFRIVYLTDGETGFRLELTWLRDHPQRYNLGENEIHLCLDVEDYDAAFAMHQQMGCVCFVNEKMGIYFIEDPDGYWVEILPPRD